MRELGALSPGGERKPHQGSTLNMLVNNTCWIESKLSAADLNQSPIALLGQRIAFLGLLIYAVFAPHSVAASSIGVAVAAIGWTTRVATTGTVGLRRSKFDLIILLSLLWTIASSLLSVEPRISINKLESLWCVLLFYLTRAVVTKRTALILVAVLILSGSVGVIYSAYDLVRGRGVVVESITVGSPFHQVDIRPGDTIWRVDGHRLYSATELNEVIRSATPNTPMTVSVFSQGEHAERSGLILTTADQMQTFPSGVTGSARSHRFRASGWTRHYETYAELLQIISQLALGIALANLRNHGPNKNFKITLGMTCLLAAGITFTAMRTVLIAFVVGASVIAWRSLRGRPKLVFTFALFLVLGFGAVVVSLTRAENALFLTDPSALLRAQVARVGLSRITLHPLFGHGMDAMKMHWTEWGFPGRDMLHLHSTPLQLAFDRGLPMLLLWLWMMSAFWIHISRAAGKTSELSDTNSYGILLGALGGLTGFLISSLVNYNYGDAEVAMMFWWLMGIALVTGEQQAGGEDSRGSRQEQTLI